MWWRLNRSQFNAGKGEGNRQALQDIVASGEIPGIIAYSAERPVGWCSVGPRDAFPALNRSRILARVDDRPVWSIVCFYVARPFRRAGLTGRLIGAAVEWATARGAKTLEAYPVEPKSGKMPDTSAYHGMASVFARAGFTEVARRSETRPVMRIELS